MSVSVAGYYRYPERADGTFFCPALRRARVGEEIIAPPWGGRDDRAWFGIVESVARVEKDWRLTYGTRHVYGIKLTKPLLQQSVGSRSPSAWAAGENHALSAMKLFDEREFDPALAQNEIESMSLELAGTSTLGRDVAGLLPTDEDGKVFMTAVWFWMTHAVSNRLAALALDVAEKDFRQRFPSLTAEQAAQINWNRR